MPTFISHAVSAYTLGKLSFSSTLPRRFWWLALFCAIIPDVDVLGLHYGINYADVWGHRGMTHSFSFAFLLSLAVVFSAFRQIQFKTLRIRLIIFFFLVASSHGILDALTNGGLGVAFFAPFDNSRYFFSYQPIQVSPISISAFIEGRAWYVLRSELVWVGLPCLILLALIKIKSYTYSRK